VPFPDYGTKLWSPGSRNFSRKAGKHCDFSTYLIKRARVQFVACAEMQFPDYGPVLWAPDSRKFQESTTISAPTLPSERELNLAHAQRCSYLIMEQRCGPLAVEIVPGKHCDFSTYLAKRARAQSEACAEVQFPDYGTMLWSTGSRNFSRKEGNTANSAPILPSERELSLEHVQRSGFLIMEQSCGPIAI
jgi:hypothetical protein